MKNRKRCIVAALFAMPALFSLSSPIFAKTFNPISLIVDGGYTAYEGASETTSLFVDRREKGGEITFWVRVENNPGTLDAQNESPVQLPVDISIKYFPESRYREVLKSVRGIATTGLVNPYVENFVICDVPNSSINFFKNSVTMAYNCGADAPNADRATFRSEVLLKALRDETVANPDMQMSTPTAAPEAACAEGTGPVCNDTPAPPNDSPVNMPVCNDVLDGPQTACAEDSPQSPVNPPECNDVPGGPQTACADESPTAAPEAACAEGTGPVCNDTPASPDNPPADLPECTDVPGGPQTACAEESPTSPPVPPVCNDVPEGLATMCAEL